MFHSTQDGLPIRPTTKFFCNAGDNILLGETFREKFADGFHRLVRTGKLRLEDEWAKLLEPQELEAWLNEFTESDWNVFIEGPPHGKSRPEHVLKYLARYMTGGPISDRRIIRDQNDRVPSGLAAKTRRREIRLSRLNSRARNSCVADQPSVGARMHILPKGYTRSRQFGGYHGGKRQDYLPHCREQLELASPPPFSQPSRRQLGLAEIMGHEARVRVQLTRLA